MLKIIGLIFISLLPAIWSLWVMRKNKQQSNARYRNINPNYYHYPIRERITPVESDRYYLEGVGYLIGDISCKFNARSGYVRCAVNPSGPCGNCRHYESKELTHYLDS
jgi:hypothetical protein